MTNYHINKYLYLLIYVCMCVCIYIYIYKYFKLVIISKQYTDISWYQNISFPWLNWNDIWYVINSLVLSTQLKSSQSIFFPNINRGCYADEYSLSLIWKLVGRNSHRHTHTYTHKKKKKNLILSKLTLISLSIYEITLISLSLYRIKESFRTSFFLL